MIKAAQVNKDPIALSIKQLKLESNFISLMLKDPYLSSDSEDEETGKMKVKPPGLKPTVVDIDLSMSAYSNARRLVDLKRNTNIFLALSVFSSV